MFTAESMELVRRSRMRSRTAGEPAPRNGRSTRWNNLTEILKAANRISLGLTLVLLVIAAISPGSQRIGIMNIMLITVTERTREIGHQEKPSRHAPRAADRVPERAMMLSCGGGLVGVLVGVAVPYSVHYFAAGHPDEIPAAGFAPGFGMTPAGGI